MAYPHGTRALGERHVGTFLAAATIVKGDLEASTEATGSNTVEVAATGKAVLGFALQAAVSTALLDIDQIRPGDRFWVKVGTGTVSASTIGKFFDITDQTAITLTNSNNDGRVVGWDGVTTNYCIVEFIFPEVTSKNN